MYFKLTAAALLLAASYSVPHAIEGVAFYLCFFAFAFYYTVWKVFVGLVDTRINTEDLQSPLLSIIVNSSCIALLWTTEYQLIGVIAIPFTLVTICTYVFTTLVAYDLITIVEVDPNDK